MKDVDRWRHEVWKALQTYEAYERRVRERRSRIATSRIKKPPSGPPRSALLPFYDWTPESRDVFLRFCGKTLRWLLRNDILVKNRVWSREARQNLTMLAEQLGFWRYYPGAPEVVLVVTESAGEYIRYCTRQQLDGSIARWIRTPLQLAWYRPDRVKKLVLLDKSRWSSLRIHPEVREYRESVRQAQIAAARKRLQRSI